MYHHRLYLDMTTYHVVFGPWQKQLVAFGIWLVLITAYFMAHPIFKVYCRLKNQMLFDLILSGLGIPTQGHWQTSRCPLHYPLLPLQHCSSLFSCISDSILRPWDWTIANSVHRTGTVSLHVVYLDLLHVHSIIVWVQICIHTYTWVLHLVGVVCNLSPDPDGTV